MNNKIPYLLTRVLFATCIGFMLFAGGFNFLSRSSSAQEQAVSAPVLISEANPTRAIAIEATSVLKEPFTTAPRGIAFSPDARTRIQLFAMNLALAPDEGPAAVTAEAQDGAGRI